MSNLFSLLTCCVFCFIFNSVIAQQITFSNVSDLMGISHPYQQERGGISFYDFNGDGMDDISVTTDTGDSLYFFKNELNLFNNITSQLGINVNNLTREILWADYDNDGDQDVFICNEGSYNRFYKNNGNNNFQDVTTQSGFPLSENSTNAACWGDYNNDGFLDIYVTNYSEFNGNNLYKNNGDGTFSDVTLQAGVSDRIDLSQYRMALAVAFLDYNNDGWQDIYIANDKNRRNTLFKNMGDGTFSDISVESGSAVIGFFMGIAIGDYNDDGFLDIYTTNDPPGNALLKNNGDGTFTNVAELLGVGVYKSCWGTNFLDYDNDGDLDLFVSVSSGSSILKNPFFENNGDGTFQQLEDIGLEESYISYGNSIGDFDNNGYSDIAVFNNNATSGLYKNSGGSNNYIKLNLKGIQSNADAVGSFIHVYFNNQHLLRSTHNGQSFSAQNSKYIIIGVGEATLIDSIIIKWPLGTIDTYYNIEVNQLLNLVEGETATKVDESEIKNEDFYLYQNYPNPFNPVTNIKYSLPVNSNVIIKVFDILGREITTLENSYKTAGTHTIKFDTRKIKSFFKELSSGIYLYRIIANGINNKNFSFTNKMIYTK